MTQKIKTGEADLWMPLWIGDYMKGTMTLSTLEHGAYLLLLMAYWINRAALPDSDSSLMNITKTNKNEWKKLRPVLSKFFVVGNQVWRQQRVENEMVKANIQKAVATNRGKAGAKARWGNSSQSNEDSMPKHMLGHSSSPPPPPPSGFHKPKLVHKENVCGTGPHTDIPDEFRKIIVDMRPDLSPNSIYQNFAAHYAGKRQDIARWEQWVAREFSPFKSNEAAAKENQNPREDLEARASLVGIEKWQSIDQYEQWFSYQDRVINAEKMQRTG